MCSFSGLASGAGDNPPSVLQPSDVLMKHSEAVVLHLRGTLAHYSYGQTSKERLFPEEPSLV